MLSFSYFPTFAFSSKPAKIEKYDPPVHEDY